MKFIKKRERNELVFLNKVSKKILSKTNYKKVSNLKDKEEKRDVLKYAIRTELEKRYSALSRKIKSLEKKKKDVFFISIRGNLLNLKIKYFNVTYHKSDFKVIMKLFKQIERDLKYV